MLAEDATTGVRVGARWARPPPADHPGYGYVAPDVPELTLGVLPAHRRRGVGGALLDAVVAAGRERGLARLSLSVEDGNGVVASTAPGASSPWGGRATRTPWPWT